jgi:hypothetical protein
LGKYICYVVSLDHFVSPWYSRFEYMGIMPTNS